MSNYEALFEDEDNIFGGTPESKYHDIVAARGVEDFWSDLAIKIYVKYSAMNKTEVKKILYHPEDCWLLPQNCLPKALAVFLQKRQIVELMNPD